MKIALVSKDKVTQVGDYRSLFPNVSFTQHGPDAEWLKANGAMSVTEYKEFNPLTERLVACAPYVDGGVVSTVAVAMLTADDLASIAESKWAKIRAQRDGMITSCDWTQLVDNPMTRATKNKWAVYRQALRDITTRGDPHNVVWPVAPK